MVLEAYLWIAIVGSFIGFFYAFWIGANDVANAFASSVSSKSITLKQAVMLAAVFEFLGALLLGAPVTSTIRSKIFDTKLYENQPDIVLLGMFTSLITGTLMLMIATWWGMPVSTTHTIVGCIMGFTIVAKGFSSVNWDTATQIFISWIASPGCSGLCGFLFFGAIKLFVHGSSDPFTRAFYTFPIVLTVFIGIDLFYILFKGFNNTSFAASLSLEVVLPVGFGAGFFCGLLWIFIFGPIAKRRVLERAARMEAEKAEAAAKQLDDVEVDEDDTKEKAAAGPEQEVSFSPDNKTEVSSKAGAEVKVSEQKDVEAPSEVKATELKDVEEQSSPMDRLKKWQKSFEENTYGQDLHAQSMEERHRSEEIWDNAENFDPNAEQLFTYVQVFTACLNSFAHGANDVANAIAPMSAIIYIYETGTLASKSPVQKWVLAYGGVGIVVGLLVYGYKVMKSIGFHLTKLTPSRGASAELGASLFVVTASFLGIPVSSTQAIVGAVTGVGLVGGVKNVQWMFLLTVCFSWCTIFLSAVLGNAAIFAMFAYTPSLAPIYVAPAAKPKTNSTNTTSTTNTTKTNTSATFNRTITSNGTFTANGTFPFNGTDFFNATGNETFGV